MSMQADAVIGFSVNPHVEWTNVPETKPGYKQKADARFGVSGSSFNVALAMRLCGRTPLLLGAVGQGDLLNPIVERELKSQKIGYKLLPVLEKTRLTHLEPETQRHLSDKSKIVRQINREDKLKELLLEAGVSFTIITGLSPEVEEISMAEKLFAVKRGTRILNPREDLAANHAQFGHICELTDMLFMNRFEAAAFLGCGPDEVGIEHLKEFERFSCSLVVITLDGRGLLAAYGGKKISLPAYNHGQKVDEKGAGDCLLGFYVSSWLNQFGIFESLQLANIAAGIKVSRVGTTAFPSYQEVLNIHRSLAVSRV